MSEPGSFVRTMSEDGVTVIELNRPERLNAIDEPAVLDLAAALRAAGRDPGCRVVVLTGAGRSFCAGLDLKRGIGDPDAALPTSKHTETVVADSDGVVSELDAYKVGVASWRLGAGRARRDDVVQAGAGVTIHAHLGDQVKAGELILTLHTDDEHRFERAREALDGGIAISTVAPARESVLLDRIS